MWVWILHFDRFWETFFQEVGCDGTDISAYIDLEVRLHIQSVVPDFGTITMLYLWMNIFILLFYIYINKINISSVTYYFCIVQLINKINISSVTFYFCIVQLINKINISSVTFYFCIAQLILWLLSLSL